MQPIAALQQMRPHQGRARCSAASCLRSTPAATTLTHQALDMFGALRRFDDARRWADEFTRCGRSQAGGGGGGGAAVADLVSRQAEWSEQTANYDAAVEMYTRVTWDVVEVGGTMGALS